MGAILKATNLYATDPARVARSLVDRGITERFDYALQTLTDLRYGDWRELRSRGHSAVDWRFVKELKRS
jgi:hypothetical protein